MDEVASLSLAAQAKLLLAIENQKIRRVGGNKDIAIDARIIAAANCDLRKMIAEGKFREDLFHRLDLLRISIPPLSQRSRTCPNWRIISWSHFPKSIISKNRHLIRRVKDTCKVIPGLAIIVNYYTHWNGQWFYTNRVQS